MKLLKIIRESVLSDQTFLFLLKETSERNETVHSANNRITRENIDLKNQSTFRTNSREFFQYRLSETLVTTIPLLEAE